MSNKGLKFHPQALTTAALMTLADAAEGHPDSSATCEKGPL